MNWAKKAATIGGCALPDPDATAIAVRHLAALKAAGVKFTWGWGSRGPFAGERHDHDSLLDHRYRFRRDGVTTYVSEPYSVYDWEGIAAAERAGWHVVIAGGLYYPGATVAIHFTKRAKP